MIWRRNFSLFIPFALSFFWLSQSVSAALLAIDYGTEWTKASLIKPGVPFDVLLNKDSKRKIHSSVAWKGDDRLFGSDAFNLVTRFPSDSFPFLKLLEGAPYESELLGVFQSVSFAQLEPTERGTVGLRRPNSDGAQWTVEELIAMQLSYIKDLAESVGTSDTRETVRDAVVVVPPYFTQFERDAVADALELAGLRLLALVNDGTAVALNYAMTRSFGDKKEWHVVYDAGAGGIRASVVGFEGGKGTQITVAGVGFDRGAGGLELDRRLRDMLASEFASAHGKPITEDLRGMARLLKEAGRVKAILSTNTEASSYVESIAFDKDFRTKITRAAFESACEDLHSRFAQPILDALTNAGLTIDDITSVILFGGHSRTPMVQAAVKAAVGESKIATSVNADEAAVLGGALYGASVSRQFRTKDIKVTDIVPYDIEVSYTTQPKLIEGEDEAQVTLTAPKTLHNLIFPAGSKAGGKKVMTFKRKDDFTVTMSYKGSVGYGLPTDLLEAEISGVKEAIEELLEAGATDPVVKATVLVTESGFAGIKDAIAYGEIKKDESITDKIKGFFGSKEGNKEGDEDVASNDTPPEAESSVTTPTETPTSTAEPTESTDAASTTSSNSAPSSSPLAKRKPARETIPLKLTVKPLSIPALTPAEIRRSRDRLVALDTAEATKRRREETRNNLESYLYRLRDLLEEDGSNPFVKCSTDIERQSIQEKVEETLHWMNEDGDHAQLNELRNKIDSLERLERPIQFRYSEIQAFPSTLNESQRINWATRIFITEARKNLTMERMPDGLPAFYTEEEVDSLEASLREHERWLFEQVERQKAVQPYEDPVLTTAELRAKVKPLDTALMKLVRRKAPPKSKKLSSTTSSTTVASETASESSATSTTSIPDADAESTPAPSPSKPISSDTPEQNETTSEVGGSEETPVDERKHDEL